MLVLDDWGLEKMTLGQRNDLLEIMKDRHGLRSTLITSQLPINQWHQAIGDATLADAILAGLPVALVLLVIVWSLLRGLREEPQAPREGIHDRRSCELWTGSRLCHEQKEPGEV